MNRTSLLSLFSLGVAVLLGSGCDRPAPVDPHAGHNHGPGEGHGAKQAPAPAVVDEHAGHNHGPGEGHGEAVAEEESDPHAGHNHGPGEGHGEAADEGAGAEDMCGEHGVPVAVCGICNPDAIGALQPGEGLKVRLPAAESARLVGLETAAPRTGAIADVVACYAELAFNQNRLAQLSAPVGGVLREVLADLGDVVQEGQTVARLWSPVIGETVARAVLAHQTLARAQKLRAEGIGPARELEEAEAAHRAACQQARLLGFSEQDIDHLGDRPEDPVLLEVRAPFAGELIERSAVRGAPVEAGRPLFTLADRSTMWAMLSIPDIQLDRVRTGQVVELTVDALPGQVFTGRLTWISAQVDERTRMARARAEVANPDGRLRDRAFARARIITRRAEQALLLPAAAIQRVGDAALVFVRQADDLYDARAVHVGAQDGGQVEVRAGLRADEAVVVGQAFVVKSHLLISRLGAGCAHE